MTKSLKDVMIEQFENTFSEILRSQFRSHPELSVTFFSANTGKRKDIEKEIPKISNEMARALVRKLETEGYLKRKPSDARLQELIVEVLKEYGVKHE